MNGEVKKHTLIDKEEVLNLKFPNDEVLKSKEDIAYRKIDIERATSLGNLEHTKFKIVFDDGQGIKQVETTIWAMTDKRIILKKGAVIPINRIIELK